MKIISEIHGVEREFPMGWKPDHDINETVSRLRSDFKWHWEWEDVWCIPGGCRVALFRGELWITETWSMNEPVVRAVNLPPQYG